MSNEPEALSLTELLDKLGMSTTWVAEQLGLTRWGFVVGRYGTGRVTQQEIDRLAEILRCERQLVEDALRENARRHEAAKAAPTSSSGGKSA